jgi:cysteine synthase A
VTLLINPEIIDKSTRARAVAELRERGVVLPTFSQIAHPPTRIPSSVSVRLNDIGIDDPCPENLWRIHWYNVPDQKDRADVPGYIVLTKAITGVDAPILVLLGSRFPMIHTHKVLPAYSALVSHLVTGRFDSEIHKAVWPSTGNYCRGGITVSRILGCRGVAVLPAGMSRERFEWLDRWVVQPDDIIRTPGTESNVKEIYDKCAELRRDPQNLILNQFSEFSNYLIHHAATGRAVGKAFQAINSNWAHRLTAFVSATGSAGTIAAGDYHKTEFGTKIAAVEALECPTMLDNGFGEHNIQGIGDKHIPLIHNVMNTDMVIGVYDEVTNRLNLLFGAEIGREYLLRRRNFDASLVAALADVGLSSFTNIVAAIKLAKQMRYGPEDVIATVATDSGSLYESERKGYLSKHYRDGFDEVNAAELFGASLLSVATDHVVELTEACRRRIFNLGYYTWVEQQGISLEDFESRRSQSFWAGISGRLVEWDSLIEDFNAEAWGA